MKEVTRQMMDEYKIKDFDFMGYNITEMKKISFHHLIVARRNCKNAGLGDGYYKWNGAILVQDTSHDYLHLIERIDPEIFYCVTSEMIDQNLKGKLDLENLRQIRNLLIYFEREHCGKSDKHGKQLIKTQYVQNRFSCLN